MICLDRYILRKHWLPEHTDWVISACEKMEKETGFPGTTAILVEYLKKRTPIEPLRDCEFEVQCARAFCRVHRTPFFVHANIIAEIVGEISDTRKPPLFSGNPFRFEPPYSPAESLADMFPSEFASAEELLPLSRAEAAVESCAHSAMRGSGGLEIRRGLRHLDFLSFLTDELPRCAKCGALIICSCVREVFLIHIGRSFSVLDEGEIGRRSRKADECIGFRDGLCDLCSTRRTGVPEDDRFWNAVPGLRAIDAFRRECPTQYQQLKHVWHAQIDSERAPWAELQPLIACYEQIMRGANVHDLRLQYEASTSKVPPRDLFRHYFQEVRSQFRERFGLPGIGKGRVGESKLLRVVREMFPEERVFHNARPNWLEGLELDVFIPECNLAFEYMGQQHYKPIDHFGGTDAFQIRIANDERKVQICRERGVHLVHIHYADEVTRESITEILAESYKVSSP
jgi:hypothetical protein